ncbi:hypothetical protein IGI04_040069 [Brassica rapa subsp. trilocularis]|uniref:Uncharacterized protein n=1 Tax=Brassica rapa subsp. trilocularis TaxID=1813537 RepID=A0ABQ7KLR3_BRACM|nr:hypothetical protein IGI04_040069 [Brassica rapa subsp. trilocularis]
MEIMFCVLMFKEVRESHLIGRKRMCKFSLYTETKILIRLNIFDPEDFWKTYAGCVGRLHFKFSI